uniref:Hexosyltransferase n=1 Tax=Toxocara canis TaxID=6265 RepID=A0A183UFE4_TOXCA
LFRSVQNGDAVIRKSITDHPGSTSADQPTTKFRFKYPQRISMGECPPLFGNITVLVAVTDRSYETEHDALKNSICRHYRVAQETLECYLRSVNYNLLLVDLDSDKRVMKECKHDQVFFKKHCAASVYLEDTDWMLVLDADTGVVNPNHCIEEWIDPRVDLIFYERFLNWEIASGNYLCHVLNAQQVKNTPFARNFLRKWADWQYTQPSNWNGAITVFCRLAVHACTREYFQMHILQTVLPDAKQEIRNCDAIWHRGTDYDTYMAFVTCVKIYLGATRVWPGKIRILRRAHGWVRDGYLTAERWSDRDFMLHGWKLQKIGEAGWESPFTDVMNAEECGQNFDAWHWRNTSHVSDEKIKKMLSEFEYHAARNYPKVAKLIPYLNEPDIAECFPSCDDYSMSQLE